jgi:hypothetical protein
MRTPHAPIPDDPTLQRLRALIAHHDAELLEGLDDVDRTLVASSLARDPWQRLKDSFEQHDALRELARCLQANSTR